DRLALQYATDASVRSGERERATEFGSRYQRQDENCRAPAGATGTESLPNAIAIFDSLVRVRPASLGCREAQLRVLKAAHQWRRVIAAADTLAQLDSSYATEAFQLRLARDISRDSQPALAAEMLGRVTAARPQSVDLWLLYAQMLDEAGEYRQAIGVARYALGLDSARATAWLRIATEHSKLNEPDSVLALARVAAPRVDSVGRFQLAQSLLSQAGPLYKVAERTKARADFERVLPLVLVADTLAGAVPLRAQAKLLIGALRLMIGQSLAQEAARSRSCEMARDAQASLNAAQVAAPAGGAASPAAAAQIMQGALQASDYAARLAAAVCRKGRDE
ncbi:MAG TPA: hypothetical protein VKA84_20890, partial [Gemmatimonadaceae bacterium]|nr:hypothetical protein [Gemmatimonadaceae bacterium]